MKLLLLFLLLSSQQILTFSLEKKFKKRQTIAQLRFSKQQRLNQKYEKMKGSLLQKNAKNNKKQKYIDGDDKKTNKKHVDQDIKNIEYIENYRELRINLNNVNEQNFKEENEEQYITDLQRKNENQTNVNDNVSDECIVELKDKQVDETDDYSQQEDNRSIEENDVCECNVKCIENCSNIQLGTEGLPVIYLEKNKYMIEINEQLNNTCQQSCQENLQKLGCQVKNQKYDNQKN